MVGRRDDVGRSSEFVNIWVVECGRELSITRCPSAKVEHESIRADKLILTDCLGSALPMKGGRVSFTGCQRQRVVFAALAAFSSLSCQLCVGLAGQVLCKLNTVAAYDAYREHV